jgi:hypothetical protein
MVSDHASELSDDVENESAPRLAAGMRDIGAVMSSTFIIARGMLETRRERELAKFAAELRYRMIPIAVDRWKTHLEWNKAVITTYAEVMKLYFTAVIDVGGHNYEMATKNKLWPFTVLEYQRAALGALTGAHDTNTDVAGSSKSQKVIGGALTGAAAGAMVTGGNPVGAVVGGVLGLASGFL